MSTILGGRRLLMLIGACAVFVAAAGLAGAAIPGSTGVVNGCYEKRTGLLRVIDAEAGKRCLSIETPIAWNQQGLPGERGAEGPPGPKGDAGEGIEVVLPRIQALEEALTRLDVQQRELGRDVSSLAATAQNGLALLVERTNALGSQNATQERALEALTAQNASQQQTLTALGTANSELEAALAALTARVSALENSKG